MVIYENIVKELIKTVRPDIQKPQQIKSIKTVLYSIESYQSVVQFIKAGNIENIQDAEVSGPFREFLDIIAFRDSEGLKYVATVYDSDELWQDPRIVDIIRL